MPLDFLKRFNKNYEKVYTETHDMNGKKIGKTKVSYVKKQENNRLKWPDETEWKEIHNRFDNVKEAHKIHDQLSKSDYYGDIEILPVTQSYLERQIGIKVYRDHIKTKRTIIKYSKYGLANLDLPSARQFAFWLADFLPKGTVFHCHTIYQKGRRWNKTILLCYTR